MSKEVLRACVRSQIKSLSTQIKSLQSYEISKKLIELLRRDYQRIGCYVPSPTEVDIRTAIMHWSREKRVITIPQVAEDQSMSFRDLSGRITPVDVVIVPGIAFDQERYRLGRGKGCYDRWIAENPDVPTIGVAFDVQLVESLPHEAHDCKVSMLIHAGGYRVGLLKSGRAMADVPLSY